MSELISLFEQAPALLFLTTALFGLAVGSFLNVLILRLPRIMEQEWREECAELLASENLAASQQDAPTPAAESAESAAESAAEPAAAPSQQASPTSETTTAPRLSLSRPGSHCPSCGTAIRALDNIPILSWLRLRGRCRACEAKISIRYPLVEALTAVLSVVVVWQLGPTPAALAALILTWGLVALAIIDFDTQLLPDSLTLPLLWLGLLLSLGGTFTDPTSAILGAAAGYLLLWLVFQAFRITTGKEGMGRGDFKLLALFGAWLGWQAVPQIILLSALPGAIVGVALIASGRQQAGQPIPYGPFLAIAGWISLLWGEAITGAYLSWAGLA
ncbi:A24 family peptidase [Lamprobacter modestohalophilus]|uniref:prepilin peptidase n=1 Tax=Lamprobacter modestohalophilus TaxID=1064514 RepID=UPI002ADEFC00|nr:A24 family peptidase [Lamprobacter modestohalophilus]MEA1048595.1 A24 family peptidase [Lamprobacter modestohalophilus]